MCWLASLHEGPALGRVSMVENPVLLKNKS